jgi:hypothetical protein
MLTSLVLKSVSLIMYETETMKTAQTRSTIFSIWALAVKEYEQKTSIQARVIQSLREEYLAEYMADFLHFAQTEHALSELVEFTRRYVSSN